MPVTLYEALWIFVIYAFVGWCIEVAYAGLNQGVFVNRGFMNGPYCPIYGCGMLIVIAVLTPLQDSLLILFVGSVLLTTVLEYITGLVLEKVFGNRWWDYSNLPFNIQGYVCLKFSILWGIGCVFIMEVIHPLIEKWIQWIPEKIGIILLAVLLIGFVADLCVTVNTILKFNRHLKSLEKVAAAMHKLSDELGEDIFEKVAVVVDKSEEMGEYLSEKRSEWENLNREYRQMLEQKHFGFKRLTKAFPDMISKNRNEILQEYKESLKIKLPPKKK